MSIRDEYVTDNFRSVEYYKGEDEFVATIEAKNVPLKWYIDRELALRNQAVREHFKCYVSLTNGVRSKEHNDRLIKEGLNASTVSQHLFQRASDIQVYKMVNGKKEFIPATAVVKFLKEKYSYGAIGAVNEKTVHHDTRNADGWVDLKY